MSESYVFECEFCGKNFGTDPVSLAIHIGKCHDSPRKNNTWYNRILATLKCSNKKIGCYHDNSVHLDGNGKCIVRGCKCDKFMD